MAPLLLAYRSVYRLLRRYQITTGLGWLERGGVYVMANLRGGGEYGPSWHQAALKENRNLCTADMACIAEHLVKRGVTTTGQLAMHGGSNGGLLMGNMLTQYVQLFALPVPLL